MSTGARGKKAKRRPSAIVPSVVFGATFAGVVPLCVASVSCGGTGGSPDAGNDVQYLGVGCIGFDAGCNGVAADAFGVFVAFDAGVDVEAGGDADGGAPLEAPTDAPAESGDGGGDQ